MPLYGVTEITVFIIFYFVFFTNFPQPPLLLVKNIRRILTPRRALGESI